MLEVHDSVSSILTPGTIHTPVPQSAEGQSQKLVVVGSSPTRRTMERNPAAVLALVANEMRPFAAFGSTPVRSAIFGTVSRGGVTPVSKTGRTGASSRGFDSSLFRSFGKHQ